ncbi:RNA-directed DNA polymerase, eukaryota, nucleotide-binding alpha-beta plait domain protein [Tanacetum coccineum]
MAWTKVRNRSNKHERVSVFDRMGTARSNEDDISTISQSNFITNFPSACGKKELWEIGKRHGVVVDVFIPNRLSKAGKRFAFMKFIRIQDVDKLVALLREEWVGNFHLFACKPRFDRVSMGDSKEKHNHKNHTIDIRHMHDQSSRNGRSYVNVVKGD